MSSAKITRLQNSVRLTRPPSVNISQMREWIMCDWEELDPERFKMLAGFGILVRTGITIQEQDDLIRRNRENQQAIEAFEALPEDEQKAVPEENQPYNLQWQILAPYVLDWNLEAEDINDKMIPVPPPAVAGYKAFNMVTLDHIYWITRIVLHGYQATGKAFASVKPFGITGNTNESDAETAATVADPDAPTNSSTPSG